MNGRTAGTVCYIADVRCCGVSVIRNSTGNYICTFNVHIFSGGSVWGGDPEVCSYKVAIVKNQPPDFEQLMPYTRRAR